MNSSLPSQNIVAATTFSYAAFNLDTWYGDFSDLNQEDTWKPYVIALSFYLVASMLHLNVGAVYPSDCLFSLIPSVLIIFTHWIGVKICEASHICPTCDGGFCYYTPGDGIQEVTHVVRRSNLNMWELHGFSNTLMLVAGFIVLTLLVYPIEYWQKITYFLSMMLAVWIFQNTLLCPNDRNNHSGVYNPTLSEGIPTDSNRTTLIVAFLVFMAGVNWIVTNLLTKRTGAVLSALIVTIFYVVVLMWTLHCLITVRLLI